MDNRKSPDWGFWLYFAGTALGLYVGAYGVCRWQKVLIRTASYYSTNEALYENSHIRSGFWYGETGLGRFRQAAAVPAERLFRPLCIAEAAGRNRFFPRVNIDR